MKQWPYNLQAFFLCCLTILLVWNPQYLHQKINVFEWGLYLPGIDAILHGKVPYRDFFYLRGPLELYFPAFLMKLFGENAAILATYFYAGTVATLLIAVLIAGELLEQRAFWWILTPLLVARTFPRVVFTFWGGFRYAWGLLAVYCLIKFIKARHWGWILGAGILTSIAGLTSAEIGISAGMAAVTILIVQGIYSSNVQTIIKNIGVYMMGVLIVLLPMMVYFQSQGALPAMAETMLQVATSMTKIFIPLPMPPANLNEALAASVNPHNHNFRHMTPVYCYSAFFIYLIRRVYIRKISVLDWAAGGLAVYGVMIYVTGFRNIEASVFEMALQPEKVILFFLLGKAFIFLKEKGLKYPAYVLVTAVLISSLTFSVSHMNKRFYIFQGFKKHKKVNLEEEPSVRLELPRMKSLVVPLRQAEDFNQIKSFLESRTQPDEPVFMFPELGTLNFIVERPSVGRFASTSLSWLKDSWHREVMEDIQEKRPKYAVINKVFPEHFEKQYFIVKGNKEKFDEVFSYIQQNYVIVAQSPSYNIYQAK